MLFSTCFLIQTFWVKSFVWIPIHNRKNVQMFEWNFTWFAYTHMSVSLFSTSTSTSAANSNTTSTYLRTTSSSSTSIVSYISTSAATTTSTRLIGVVVDGRRPCRLPMVPIGVHTPFHITSAKCWQRRSSLNVFAYIYICTNIYIYTSLYQF